MSVNLQKCECKIHGYDCIYNKNIIKNHEHTINILLNNIKELKSENDELKLENHELKIEMTGINSLNKKLKSENHILKKEVEYYNSLKQKYDYNEMKQNKKILHNEYKRIYKLIKKNIGFNLC
jgi:hypothetical protein